MEHSDEMLAICKNKIIENKLEAYFGLVLQDFRYFSLKRKAKFIILPFKTIGHFLSFYDKKQVLKNIYNNLDKNGTFVLDHYILDRVWAETHQDILIEMYRDEKMAIYDKYHFDFNQSILNCAIFQEKLGVIKKQTDFDYSWIAPKQMEALFHAVGFQVINVYGDFNFNALDCSSEQQIWVVKK